MNPDQSESINRRKFCQLGSLVALAAFGPAVASAESAPPDNKKGKSLKFSAGALGDGAKGNCQVKFVNGRVTGRIEAHKLPKLQTGEFYIAWYTNLEHGNAAFLGALVQHDSILFPKNGLNGHLNFNAPEYTVHLPFADTEALVGSPVERGANGKNQIVVLVETAINGRSPAPVVPPAGFPPGPVDSLVLGVTF